VPNLFLPDLAIGLATVLGLVAVVWRMRDQQDVTLGHLRRLMILAIVFYGARNIEWMTGGALARSLTISSAALLPLMAFLALEALLRRHAAGWMKLFIAGGGAVLALLALVPVVNGFAGFLFLLLVYQLISFALLIWFVLAREYDSLSKAENAMIDRMGIGLLIMLPLLFSDYRNPEWLFPASMSGIAVLITCWVLVHLNDREMGRRRMTLELALLAAFSGIAAIYAAQHADVDLKTGLQMLVMLLAFTLAASVIVGCQRLSWRSAARISIAQGLTQDVSAEAYLNSLKSNGLSESILGADLLAGFDGKALVEAFGEDGAVALVELPKDAGKDTMGQSQMRALFARSGTTQAYLATRAPLRIAVGQRHGLAGGPDPELLAAFGLSRLMAERDSARGKT